jgi:hypothetical protein
MPVALEPLRLLAQDADDLKVLSAALQDAVTKIGDIHYEPVARRLTIAFNRYRWEAPGRSRERVRAGLQFGGVLGVQARHLRRDATGAVIELLAVAFEPDEPPGGLITLTFAGGGDLRLQVECIDAALADLSPAWPARGAPRHG